MGRSRSQVPSQLCLQLMSMILIMVMTKKGRASMGTFTRAAVIRNTSRMASRLPRIRTAWGILRERPRWQRGAAAAGVQPGVRLDPLAHLRCKKELRQVKSSRGSMAHKVMTLLKMALR